MVGRRSRPDPVVSEYVQQRLAALLAETPARRAAPEAGPAPTPVSESVSESTPARMRAAVPGSGSGVRGRSGTSVPSAAELEPLDEFPGPDGPGSPGAPEPTGGRVPSGDPAPPVGDGGGTGGADRGQPPQPPSALIGLPFTRRHLLVIAVVVVLAAGVAGTALLRARPVALATPTTETSAASTAAPTDGGSPGGGPGGGDSGGSASPEPAPILVHVLGEVREPGVVELSEGARVRDALSQAGGLTEAAVPGDLNLAQPLTDGQQVLVADRADDSGVREAAGGSADPGNGATDSGGGSTGGAAGGGQLDLNAASEAQLLELPGVGPVTAGRIIAWREENGRFSRVEELQEVDGIGPKTFAQLASLVRV